MTPEPTELAAMVLRRLSDGHWLILDVIARECGVPRRMAEETVQSLRLSGHPLVTGPAGVRYSTDPAEVRATAMKLRDRALTQMVTAKALDDTADRMESGPMTLGLVA